jgi:hypothetical protein
MEDFVPSSNNVNCVRFRIRTVGRPKNFRMIHEMALSLESL